MNKTLIARISTAVFLLNIFAPGADIFAQERIGQPKYNVTGHKTDIINQQYTSLHYDREHDINLVHKHKKSIVPFIKNAPYVDKAELRLFLNSAEDGIFFDYLLNNEIPKNTMESVLKRLNLMLEDGSLTLLDAIALIAAPTDEIALFGTTFLNISLNEPLKENNATILAQFAQTNPELPSFLIQRLEKIKHNLSTREAASLWAGLQATLAQFKEIGDLTGIPSLLSKEQQEKLTGSILTKIAALSSANEASLIIAESGTMTLMKYQGISGFARTVEMLDAKNTKLSGQKNQQLKGSFSDLIGVVFNAFMVEFAPRMQGKGKQLTRKEWQEARDVLFKFTNPSYSANTHFGALTTLSAFYLNKSNHPLSKPLIQDLKYSLISDTEAQEVADRIKKDFYCRMAGSPISQFGFSSQEMAMMQNVLAAYYNNIRRDNQHTLVALNKQGKAMNNVCVVMDKNEPNKHLRSKEQTTMLMGILITWPILDFTVSYIIIGAKSAWQMGRLINTATMMPKNMTLGYVSTYSAASGQVTGSLAHANRMAKLEKNLADIGVTIDKQTKRYGRFTGKDKGTVVENVFTKTSGFHLYEAPAIYPAAPKYVGKRVNGKVVKTKEVEGYYIQQHAPGGIRKTYAVEANVIQGNATNSVVNASHAGTKSIRSMEELVDTYVTKVDFSQFGGKQAYKEILSSEQILHKGYSVLRHQHTQPRGLSLLKRQKPSGLPGTTITAALYPDATFGLGYMFVPVIFDAIFAPTDFFAKPELNRRAHNKLIDRYNQTAKQKEAANEDYKDYIKSLDLGLYAEDDIVQLYGNDEVRGVKPRQNYGQALSESVQESPLAIISSTITLAMDFIWDDGVMGFVNWVQAPTPKNPKAARQQVMQNNPYVKMYQEKIQKESAQAHREYERMEEQAYEEQVRNDLGLHPNTPLTPMHTMKWEKQNKELMEEYLKNLSTETEEWDWEDYTEEGADDWYF